MKKLSLRYTLLWVAILFFLTVLGAVCAVTARVAPSQTHTVYAALCKVFYKTLSFFLSIEIIGGESIQSEKKYIITANHQSFTDTPLCMGILSHFGIYPRFIMKESLRYWPIISIFAYHLKFLYLDRHSPKKALLQIRQSLLEKTKVTDWMLFPEGTRAPVGTVSSPKAAGLYWLMQTYPEYAWLDLTILYQGNSIKIIITALPHITDKNILERTLEEIYQVKIAAGLTPYTTPLAGKTL